MADKTPGERLRAMVKPKDQAKLVEFMLGVADRCPDARADELELRDRLEAEAAIAINTTTPAERHVGRLYYATEAAEPEGLSVVIGNILGFYATGDLPARWTA